MSEKLLGLVAAAAGVAETQAAELATTDEGIAELQTKITAKLADIRKDANGRALKIATAAFTKAGVDPALFEEGRDFKDNVAAAVESLQGTALESAGKGTLTDEEVLRLPAVKKLKQDLLTEADRKVEAAKKEAETQLQQDRQAFKAEQVEAKAGKYVDSVIDELNPDFGTNPTIAANRRKELKKKLLSELKWDAEGDEVRLLDDEGEVLRDASLSLVQPAEKVREVVTSYYELPVSTHKDSPGITPDSAVRQPVPAYKGPTTQAEYEEKLNLTRPGSTERAELMSGFATYKKTQADA